MLPTEQQLINCDVNGNGSIDISDAVVLVNYILGNDTILEGSGHEDISSGNTAINNQIYG